MEELRLEVSWLGRVPYREAWGRQHELVARRRAEQFTDQLLLLEHEPVLTLGRHSDPQHILANEADERLFEHYTASQLARVSLDGTVTRLGKPGIHWDLAASPDGRYLLVQTLHRPFSYVVPAGRFPRRPGGPGPGPIAA